MNTCVVCSVDIPAHRVKRRAKYCSDRCAQSSRRHVRDFKRFPPRALKCAVCDSPLSEEKWRRNAIYCGAACKKMSDEKQYREYNPEVDYLPGLPSGTIGAIHEIFVCADLLGRGYEVFRSVSPSCSCDLAILKDHKLIRVECTTGRYIKSGRILHPQKDTKKYDVLAIVVGKTIIYKPDNF